MNIISVDCGTVALPVQIMLHAGEQSDKVLRIDRIELKSADIFLASADIKPAIDVPLILLTDRDGQKGFKTATALQAEIEELLAEGHRRLAADVKTQREDLTRRLRHVTVDWRQGGTFFQGQLAATMRGSVSLAVEQLLGPAAGEIGVDVAARALFELRAEVSIAEAHMQGAVSLVVRLRAGTEATISLDLDDLDLSLPELTLPHFDFTGLDLALPDLARLPARSAGIFGRFSSAVTVDVAAANPAAPPRLVVILDASGLRAAIVTQGSDPGGLQGAGNRAILAPLKITIKHTDENGVTELASVAEARVGIFTADAITEIHGVQVHPIPLQDGMHNLSPLKIDWHGAKITPLLGEIGTDADTTDTLCALIGFERLTLSLVDDPKTTISLKGEIAMTPSGMRVRSLAIVEPYPITLAREAGEFLLRGAEQLINLLGWVDIGDAGVLDGLTKILNVLGRMAAAVGRAAVSISDALIDVLETAAEALGVALAGAAEMIGDLLTKLAELLPDNVDGVSPPRLLFEVRCSTSPFSLRQVLVSLRQPAGGGEPTKLTALGLELELSGKWHPSVLLDLTGPPAAYLLARRAPEGAGENFGDVATLSTDLWLASGKDVRSVRDADDKGDRPPKRLITLSVSTPMKAVMLVGLEGGEARFLQKVTDRGGQEIAIGDLRVLDGGLEMADPAGTDLAVKVDFDKGRILPLLGMGEPGTETAPAGTTGDSFLTRLQDSLGQVVTVTDSSSKYFAADKEVAVKLDLAVQVAGLKSAVGLELLFSLKTFEARVEGGNSVVVRGKPIDETALGLRWLVTPKPKDDGWPRDTDADGNYALFEMSFAGGEQSLALHPEAQMAVRFDALSADGSGIVFDVETFGVGRSGLDLRAAVKRSTVKLGGLDAPFEFTEGRLDIAGSRLSHAVLTGRGRLPEQLVGEADCKVTLSLVQEAGGIALQSGKVELEKIGQPIVCHATRFTVTLNDVGIGFAREDGRYHFYFLLTGSLRFTPKSGEFEDGLLKHLSDVEITLDQVPLTSDARVLARHISFQKAIKPPRSFDLFNLFTMQIKGIGYHPASPKFDGDPAICISGQIAFVEIGDIAKPKIDFHGLWIAPPKSGESLPRIKADGLGVDLQLSGAVKVRGTVIAVDPDTRTVEGHELAPAGYSARGFLGEGELEIPGWGNLEASLGFLEVEKHSTGERKLAFFFYLQKDKLAVEIPTPIWTFWLREAGFGFSYRYTLAGIKDAEEARSVAQLIRILDEVSKTQGDLAKLPAWKPDTDKDNFTLALRGAFQPYPASKTWSQKREETATMPFFFDVVAALRSDMTLLMSARGWLGVNYNSFRTNKDDFRSRPGFRGYLYISAPRKELLLRGIADSKGFIGEDWPEMRTGSALRKAVQSVDWTTTLYIRPGLLHYEMGWPDQLRVRLVDSESMKVTVRGGMIFRAAEDGLLFGYNIEADIWLRFRGSAGGSVGAAIEAELPANLVARVIAFLAWQFKGSLVYGLASLDARLTFSVSAWMEVDLGFKSFTLRIGFSFSVQLSAAIELVITDRTVGGRVKARVAVQAFGCTLGVEVGFSFNDGVLADARARVARFLSMSLTNEETAVLPQAAAQTGDTILDQSAATAPPPVAAPVAAPAPAPGALKPDIDRTTGGKIIQKTDFWLILRQQPGGNAIGLLVPREAPDLDVAGSFYASPGLDQAPRNEAEICYTLTDIPGGADVKIWVPGTTGGPAGDFADLVNGATVHCRWNAPIPGAPGDFTLGHFFDECFRAHTYWDLAKGGQPQRKTRAYREAAQPRVHGKPTDLGADLSPRDREVARDQVQRARAHLAGIDADDERLYAARSTLMTLFLDQWSTLDAAMLPRRTEQTAHVSDLGLLFWGKPDALEKLAGMKVRKADVPAEEEEGAAAGEVTVFNRHDDWFDAADPVLAADRFEVRSEGIKLDWDLRLALAEADNPMAANPQQVLHHYRIERRIEGAGIEPAMMIVKPASLMGAVRRAKRDPETGRTPREIELVAPDWQFVDGLQDTTGVPEALRYALLPSSGPEAGLRSATLWAGLFPDREAIAITYTITPVDIAGAAALPRSFVVDVARPKVPVRAAHGEMRIVQHVVASGDDPDPRPEADLAIYLALSDPAWETVKPPDGFAIARIYRLIIETEDVVPEGAYGTDAATARIRGAVFNGPSAGAWTLELSGDPANTVFANDKGGPIPEIGGVEPDDDERAKYPFWAKFTRGRFGNAKQPVFANSKEAQRFYDLLFDPAAPGRVAVRFYLQTIVRVSRSGSSAPPVEHASEVVPLPIEHMLFGPGEASVAKVAAIRPEAFELAVPMAMPPLAPGAVEAHTGLTQFFTPNVRGSLRRLLNGEIASMPDPQRRVTTEIAFCAQPSWAASPARGVHASAIAEFDIYELDVDELAPELVDRELRGAPAAWHDAKRVAQIGEVTQETAALVPDGNRDWKAWRSHFPSSFARAAVDETQGQLPWYSSRESAAMPAARYPRIRLLPLAPEQAISDLLQRGVPERVTAHFAFAPDSAVRKTLTRHVKGEPDDEKRLALLPDIALVDLFKVFDVDPSCTDPVVELANFQPVVSGDPRAQGLGPIFAFTPLPDESGPRSFSAALLRDLLLRLRWSFAADDPLLADWHSDPLAFDGLSLVLAGRSGDYETGTSEIALELSSPIHPMIEETLAELELLRSSQARTYRGLTVMPQPAPATSAKDMAAFMAATPSETDPYGWSALQRLGLARTVRLHDPSRDRFLSGRGLAARLLAVFTQCHKRWTNSYGNQFGEPFVDVCLKPNRDIWAASFDKPQRIADTVRAATFDLDDDALAFAQIALRPAAVAAWTYYSLSVDRIEDLFVSSDNATITLTAPSAWDIERLSESAWDIERLSDGQAAAITADHPAATLSVDVWPQRFFLRCLALPSDESPTVMIRIQSGEAEVNIAADLIPCGRPLDHDGLSPYERFAEVTPLKWQAAWTAPASVACEALGAWRTAIAAALPDILFPDDKALANFAAAFVPWTDRFLAFTAGASNGADPVSYSLSTLTDDKPLRLAAGGDNWLRMRFLRADRWGAVRAYAVKPVGRYHTLLAGLGVESEQRARTLVLPAAGGGAFSDARFFMLETIGLGVAVAQRTEKIEKPLVLAARMAPEGKVAYAEAVVARHAEEALASSNRTMLARLGVPSSLTGFGRSYRHREWPERFAAELDVVAVVYPEREAGDPTDQTAFDAFTDGDLAEIAQSVPAIAAGGDIWRIAPQPPQYRLVMTSAARAGVVVSEPVVTLFEDMPRRSLAGRHDVLVGARQPAASLVRTDGVLKLQIALGLIAYRDLTLEQSESWITGGADDIAHWPDPDVVYTLSRRRKVADKNEISDEAEIRLVAELDPAADPTAAAAPVVVRTRGTQFAQGAFVATDRTVAEDRSWFAVTTRFALTRPAADEGALLLTAEAYDWPALSVFAVWATPFGAVEAQHEITAATAPVEGLPDGAAYLDQLQPLVERARSFGAIAWADRLADWILAADRTRTPVQLEQDLLASVGGTFALHLAIGTALPDGFSAGEPSAPVYFRGKDGMSDQEAISPAWQGAFAPTDERRIRALLGRRLLGGYEALWLTALDGRNVRRAGYPSLTEQPVKLPQWIEEALAP